MTAVVAGLATTVTAAPAAGPKSRPNVVLIVTDDLGYHDLGFQGSPDVRTPHLDALANRGVKFTNAYVTAPICGASRAGLLSGRYQLRESYEGNPRGNEGLALGQATVANAFHDAGYATGAFGKWSVGQGEDYRPQKRGFDEFYGFLGMQHPYVPGDVKPELRMTGETPRPGFGTPDADGGATSRPARQRSGDGPGTRPQGGGGGGGWGGQSGIGSQAGRFVRGNEEVEESGYATFAFAREAVRFIGAHKDGPFFAYVAFNASHSPLQPPDDYVRKYPDLTGKRQLYAATTTAMDDAVGQIVAELRRQGLGDNTLIAFINDNGGPINDIAANNAPLSGAKSSVWEGGIRVPFFLSHKAALPVGATRDEPVIALDVFPTLLAAAGVATPAGKQFEGRDLLPLIDGRQADAFRSRTLFWRFNNLWAVRQGKWKLTVPQARVAKPLLFDLEADVAENTDLADRYPEVVSRLSQEWADWNAKNKPVPSRGGFGRPGEDGPRSQGPQASAARP